MNARIVCCMAFSVLLAALAAACSGGGSQDAASTVGSTAVSEIQTTGTPVIAAPTSTISGGQVSLTKLNLNSATGPQFQSAIPNFPSNMVREFLEYRPYVSIQQFRREIGKYVSGSQVAAWEAYVYVPVDFNNSDAETIKQLPGVSDAIAAQLVASRPYASADAFVAKLASLVPASDATMVRAYLK